MITEYDYINRKADALTAVNSGYAWRTISVGNLVPYDYTGIQLGYDGDNLTQVIYVNGSSTVATLVLSYNSGSQLTSVSRL